MSDRPNTSLWSALFATSRSDPRWLALYLCVMAAIALYGLVVFAFVNASYEVWLEAGFFATVFPALIWPLRLND